MVAAEPFAPGVLDEPEIRAEVIAWQGQQVLAANGSIDRGALADRVFSNADDLRRLEALVHPRVASICSARIAEADPGVPAIVLDAPLLLESGLDSSCDHIVFIDTPTQIRHERLRLRSGWDADEAVRRESMQMRLDEKRSRSHHVLVNAGDSESLHKQVTGLLKHLHPRHD